MSGLTPREIQVLGLIGYGLTIPQIAVRLFRSPKTIESHRQALGQKLGIRNRVELARLAIREGLAPLEPDPDGDPASAAPWAGALTQHPAALRAVQRVVLSCWSVVEGEFLTHLVQHMTDTLAIAGTAAWSWDPARGELRQIAGGYRGREYAAIRRDADAEMWRQTLEHGVWRGLDADAATAGPPGPIDEPVRAALCVRLDGPTHGGAVGGLVVLRDRPEAFGPDVEAVLRTLSPRVAAEVQRLRG